MWQKLLEASSNVSRSVKGGNYVQFATSTINGEPRVRTVVMRGFLYEEGKLSIKVVTDQRSSKIQELQNTKVAEMCWWLPNSMEQYRLRGNVRVSDSSTSDEVLSKERVAQWNMLDKRAKESFMAQFCEEDSIETSEHSFKNVPENFLLLALQPHFVDYLNLSVQVRTQWNLESDGSWKETQQIAL